MRLLFKIELKFIIIVLLCFCSVILPTSSWALNIHSVPNPRVENGTWVTDMANILSENTESSINQSINRLEAINHAEIAVVTVPETQPAKSPKEFTTKLFNAWKIGKRGQNNGVLFLVSVKDRRVEIETGYGVKNILSDRILNNIIQQDIIPHFKQQDFDRGVLLGTKQIVNVLLSQSDRATKVSSISTYIPYKTNFFTLLLGIIGSLYYYRSFLNKVKPIYVDPKGYERQKKAFFIGKKQWRIYISFYLFIVFMTTFTIAPLIAGFSRKSLFISLIILHFYWLHKAVRQKPSLSQIIWLMLAPILFTISCLLMQSFQTFLVAILIALIFEVDRNSKISKGSIFFHIFGCILLGLVGFTINQSWQNPDEKGIILLGLASSIALTYLAWEYCQQKFKIETGNKIHCSNCQQSLNRISDALLHQYLNKPQKVAKKLGRVNYQIWQCSNCSQEDPAKVYIRAELEDAIAGYQENCPTCQELTITRQIKIAKEATYKSKGVRVHEYTCQCCQYSKQEEKTIPRKARQTSRQTNHNEYSDYSGGYDSGSCSSSYSDAGSFGGGESGSDGAGGDW